jgi:hypothetical protein
MYYNSFEEVLEDALAYGYKSVWILYRCRDDGIPLTVNDLFTIAKAYGHKTAWVKYKAEEFNIGGYGYKTNNQQKKKSEPPPKKEKPKNPLNYFDGITFGDKIGLKRRFRELSKTLHPDNMETGNESEFKKMMKQYEDKKYYF